MYVCRKGGGASKVFSLSYICTMIVSAEPRFTLYVLNWRNRIFNTSSKLQSFLLSHAGLSLLCDRACVCMGRQFVRVYLCERGGAGGALCVRWSTVCVCVCVCTVMCNAMITDVYICFIGWRVYHWLLSAIVLFI